MFWAYINERINLNLCIKTPTELDDATHYFTTLIQAAAWRSTPTPPARMEPTTNTPLHIRELIAARRRSRSRWQRSRNQGDRIAYNRLRRQLQTALRNANNTTFEHYLTTLTPSNNTFWKATQRLKRPQTSIPPSGRRTGAEPKITKKKPRHLRTTSNECSQPTLSPSIPMLQSPPS